MRQAMNNEELKNKVMNEAKRYTEERVNKAHEMLLASDKLKGIFEAMCIEGYKKEAKDFRNMVLYSYMAHPEWNQYDVLDEMVKRLHKNN